MVKHLRAFFVQHFSMILMMIKKTFTRFIADTKLGAITNVMTYSSLNNFERLNAKFQQNSQGVFEPRKSKK